MHSLVPDPVNCSVFVRPVAGRYWSSTPGLTAVQVFGTDLNSPFSSEVTYGRLGGVVRRDHEDDRRDDARDDGHAGPAQDPAPGLAQPGRGRPARAAAQPGRGTVGRPAVSHRPRLRARRIPPPPAAAGAAGYRPAWRRKWTGRPMAGPRPRCRVRTGRPAARPAGVPAARGAAADPASARVAAGRRTRRRARGYSRDGRGQADVRGDGAGSPAQPRRGLRGKALTWITGSLVVRTVLRRTIRNEDGCPSAWSGAQGRADRRSPPPASARPSR